ncbi:unnamed protein product [Nezara viridula]|uniref:Neuropeptide n=1 Tax=Nezara viridula TaxID=85310 RepID=A0A9P0E883_NEZVI|nr:unnamed protein product [Nezara viridula]
MMGVGFGQSMSFLSIVVLLVVNCAAFQELNGQLEPSDSLESTIGSEEVGYYAKDVLRLGLKRCPTLVGCCPLRLDCCRTYLCCKTGKGEIFAGRQQPC